jgi:L-threonylcarbamoyladenylate synthase
MHMLGVTTDPGDALAQLVAGEVIAFPTETVYGLGASVRQPQAAARIYELKARPLTMPLMLHVGGVEAIEAFALGVPQWALELAQRCWPGPLTLIVPARPEIDRRILGGGESAGLRAPNHGLTLQLLELLGRHEGALAALAGTSANPHGETPPTDAARARTLFSMAQLPLVLDGGACMLGIESTVLRVSEAGPEILRAGAVGAQTIAELSGREVSWSQNAAPARGRVVVLDEAELRKHRFVEGDAVVARFRRDDLNGKVDWRDLGDDLAGFGRRLYATLARLEDAGRERIYVQAAPDTQLGKAINARLARMSVPEGDEE